MSLWSNASGGSSEVRIHVTLRSAWRSEVWSLRIEAQ